MKKNGFTIMHSIFVGKPPEIVWDFTQDYGSRPKWDKAVLLATLLQSEPNRTVELKLQGNTSMTFVYKLDDRPRKTTLTAREIQSPIIASAGGSWTYAAQAGGGTLWSQTNTIVLKNGFFIRICLPVLKPLFEFQMKRAMAKAKKMMEE